MIQVLDENPMRRKILLSLKKAEYMTIADIGRQLDITPMAVRQHLLALERKGAVTYAAKKCGVGRPVFQYYLTDKAKNMFPRSYVKFSLDMLKIIEEDSGRNAVLGLLKKRKGMMGSEISGVCPTGCSNGVKLDSFVEYLNAQGAMAESSRVKRSYFLNIYNCLIVEIADTYPEICTYELEFMRDVFGQGVKLEYHILDGSTSCCFSIPVK